MRSRPPSVATWLLEHFHSGPNDYITGDLIEAYQSGRSRIWYWKEVIVAVVVSFFQEIIAHPVLAVRAITIGWATLILFYYGVGPLLGRLLIGRFFRLSGYPFGPSMLIWLTLSLFVLAASGWIVGRLHRSHRIAMVLLFTASVFIFQLRSLPGIWLAAENTLTNTRFLPYLIYGLGLHFLWPVAILVGGLWGATSDRESRGHEQLSTP
jgi:hypothetical protein